MAAQYQHIILGQAARASAGYPWLHDTLVAVAAGLVSTLVAGVAAGVAAAVAAFVVERALLRRMK